MTKCILDFQSEEIHTVKPKGSNYRLVRLYGTTQGIENTGHIGNVLRDRVERLGSPTSTQAFDLLTVSMAVTAADTFFKRDVYSDNNWARNFELHIPLVQPKKWDRLRGHLEQTLRFLTGDSWSLVFRSGGPNKPNAVGGRLRKKSNLQSVDCVCLYSGGLDSWLGVKHLLKQSKSPLLVSHSYPKDAYRQKFLYSRFDRELQWFEANASPFQYGGGNDTSMRGRSFNFLAMAAVCADAVAQLRGMSEVPLYIPENGFIALNAPLTPRRLGSHSTRTAHPRYLESVQYLFDELGLKAKIVNPFRNLTKGEMLKNSKLSSSEQRDAFATVSCGKWKRKTEQCGRCLPCLIRRASFHKAGIIDNTPYTYSIPENFMETDGKKKDDLMSVVRAVKPTEPMQLQKRAMASGPLPIDATERQEWLSVHERGLKELREYLTSQGLKCD